MSESHAELDAFRYLADEMSAEEQDRYERLLLEDEQTQAVFEEVSTISLALTSASCPEEQHNDSSPVVSTFSQTQITQPRWLVFTSLSTLIAASLLIAVVILHQQQFGPVENAVIASKEMEAARIAAHWHRLQTSTPEVAEVAEEEFAETINTSSETESGELVPSWMTLAVYSQHQAILADEAVPAHPESQAVHEEESL